AILDVREAHSGPLAMSYQLDFSDLASYPGMLAKGAAVTLELTVIGGVLGVAVGIFGAWARSARVPWLKPLVGAYVELIRNTPFIVQLFFIFFGLPSLGVKLT